MDTRAASKLPVIRSRSTMKCSTTMSETVDQYPQPHRYGAPIYDAHSVPSHHPHSLRQSRHRGASFAPPRDFIYRYACPWEHMAQTCAWISEHEFAEMARRSEETVRWVHEQQKREMLREQEHSTRIRAPFADGTAYNMRRRQHETSRAWDGEDALRTEMKRLQQARMETERRRAALQKRLAEDERRRERDRERAAAQREDGCKRAWQTYEARWKELTSPVKELTSPVTEHGQLTFGAIPWPMFSTPLTVEDITPARVTMFILSPLQSEAQSRKDRIRAALKRWHPDRFGRLLVQIEEHDQESVTEGVGIVVRCLNNLLARES